MMITLALTPTRRTLGFCLAVASALLATPSFQPARAQAASDPGPEHERIKKYEGTWTAKISSNGSESTGTLVNKMECGGLWMTTDFQGEFAGQKFHGKSFEGYDPAKKKYVSVWVDSMATVPLLMEGTFDKEKKTLTMRGEGLGPNGKTQRYKNQTVYTDDDHQTFHMYVIDDQGKEDEMLTIDYTRKK